MIAAENPQQAKQTRQELKSLVDFAADLRDREAERREVHRQAGGRARRPGPGAGGGDRRPGHPGRETARSGAAGRREVRDGVGRDMSLAAIRSRDGPARGDPPPRPSPPGRPPTRSAPTSSRRRRSCSSANGRGARSTPPKRGWPARCAPTSPDHAGGELARSRPRWRPPGAAAAELRRSRRSQRPVAGSSRRCAAAPSPSRSPRRGAATRPRRAPGCRSATSARRPASPDQASTRPPRSRDWPPARSRPQRPWSRSKRTCLTPSRRASSPTSTKPRRRRNAASAAASPKRRRSRTATGSPSRRSTASSRAPPSAASPSSDFERLAAAAAASNRAAFEAARRQVEADLEGFTAAPLTAGRAGQPRRPADPLPRPGAERVRQGHLGRPGDDPLRDPGGGRLHGRCRNRLRRPRADPARPRPGGGGADQGGLRRAAGGRRHRATGRRRRAAGGARRGPRPTPPRPSKARRRRSGPNRAKKPTTNSSTSRSTSSKRQRGPVSTSVAEQARLAAYGFFEFGPELKLRAFDPQLALKIEGLIWYGADGNAGLAQLVADKAPVGEIRETRLTLDEELADARALTGDGGSATTAIVNSALDRLPRGARGDPDPGRDHRQHDRPARAPAPARSTAAPCSPCPPAA